MQETMKLGPHELTLDIQVFKYVATTSCDWSGSLLIIQLILHCSQYLSSQEQLMAHLPKSQDSEPLAATEENNIKTQKHWNLRAGLAHNIKNTIKEVFLQIPHPIFDLWARLTMPEEDLLRCYQEARAFNPLQTQAVLTEWFPQEGNWDLFFLVIELLKSTNRYWTQDNDIPICFAGFTLPDAITLLQLDFKPHPSSHYSSDTWDLPKKQLAVHLVTKMDTMRKAQGYSSLIFDALFLS
jgi:hypothetical protein